MKNNLQKFLMSAVALLNATVVFSDEIPPPPPLPPPPPPGLPIDNGVVVLLVGALGLAFCYFKNIHTKKASK